MHTRFMTVSIETNDEEIDDDGNRSSCLATPLVQAQRYSN